MMSNIKRIGGKRCLFYVAAQAFQFSYNNIQMCAMDHVWRNGSQSKVLPLTWMYLQIRCKKEKNGVCFALCLGGGISLASVVPTLSKFKGCLKKIILQSKSKPAPDSSLSLPVEAVWMKRAALEASVFSGGGNNEHTQHLACKSSVWWFVRTVQGENWALPHSVLQYKPVPGPCKHS